MSKNNLALIFVVLVLVGGLAYFKYFKKDPIFYQPPALELKPLNVEVVEVAASTLPSKFPKDLPLEKDAVVRSNYTAESEGVFQATRSFVSKKSQEENYLLYLSYLQKNNWSIILKSDDPESKYLYAEKVSGEVDQKKKSEITISINKINIGGTDGVGVNISFVYR